MKQFVAGVPRILRSGIHRARRVLDGRRLIRALSGGETSRHRRVRR